MVMYIENDISWQKYFFQHISKKNQNFLKKNFVSSEGHLILPDIVLRGTPDVAHFYAQHQVSL